MKTTTKTTLTPATIGVALMATLAVIGFLYAAVQIITGHYTSHPF
jgi:hypothetical protein